MNNVANRKQKVNPAISSSPKIYPGLELISESRIKEIFDSCADSVGIPRLQMIPGMELTTTTCIREFLGVCRGSVNKTAAGLGHAFCFKMSAEDFMSEAKRFGVKMSPRADRENIVDVCCSGHNGAGCSKITVTKGRSMLYSYRAVANILMHQNFLYKPARILNGEAISNIIAELKREIERELEKASSKEAKPRKKQPASAPEQLTIQPVIPAEQPAMMPQMDGITDTKRTISELLYMAVKLTVQESLVDITKTLNELTTTVNAIK